MLHGIRSDFDPWLFFTHYWHLTLSKLMTPTLLKKLSEWKEISEHYSVTSKVNKEGDVQVAAFLTVIGPKARKVFKTWIPSVTEEGYSLRALSFQFMTVRAWQII